MTGADTALKITQGLDAVLAALPADKEFELITAIDRIARLARTEPALARVTLARWVGGTIGAPATLKVGDKVEIERDSGPPVAGVVTANRTTAPRRLIVETSPGVVVGIDHDAILHFRTFPWTDEAARAAWLAERKRTHGATA